MAAGIVAALAFPFIFPHTLPLYVWPLLFLISVIGCLVGTYTAPPTDNEVLKKFYSYSTSMGILETCTSAGDQRGSKFPGEQEI
jgi:hypothetical protein